MLKCEEKRRWAEGEVAHSRQKVPARLASLGGAPALSDTGSEQHWNNIGTPLEQRCQEQRNLSDDQTVRFMIKYLNIDDNCHRHVIWR